MMRTSDSKSAALAPILVSAKIRPAHQELLALVYVRQSSTKQVEENIESTEMQYRLVERAAAMGWSDDRIEVIDDDLGMSGRSVEYRVGFQRMIAEVSMGHVGIIFSIEMSRLARSCRDWHQLLENCSLFGTLLADADGVYDPRDHNDRLLLGLKGTMSEAELHVLQGRLRAGQLNKARRGEYFTHAPIGYVRSDNTLVKDPDEQVRSFVEMLFSKFIELGSLSGLVRYLRDENLTMPLRDHRGSQKGKLQWKQPNTSTLLCMLHHPIYYGAYVYGRRKTDPKKVTSGVPNSGRVWAPQDQWDVLIEDKLPTYISKQQFEGNQQKLWENAAKYRLGTAMRGTSMLAGRIVCGHCGRHMSVSYSGQKKERLTCEMSRNQWGEKQCQGFNARSLNELVCSLLLQAVAPASIELSVQAFAKLDQDRHAVERHHAQSVERAEYESDLAHRRYEEVDPSNRLVAAELERRWEQSLRDKRATEETLARFRTQRQERLTPTRLSRIESLSTDIPAVWNADTTTGMDRQTIFRALVERIVIETVGRTEYVHVMIRWSGGFESRHRIMKPVQRFEWLESASEIRELIERRKSEGKTHAEVSEELNREGYHSTSCGAFTSAIVSSLCKKFRDESQVDARNRKSNQWGLRELSHELGLRKETLNTWRRRGWVHATQESTRWTFWANEEELTRLRKLVDHNRQGLRKTPIQLTTPIMKTN
jgi:DNA invertase Pin-like site-specific DNA recombinase